MCNLYSITSSQSYVRELARTLRGVFVWEQLLHLRIEFQIKARKIMAAILRASLIPPIAMMVIGFLLHNWPA